MSLKRELEVWKRALDAYDVKDYASALADFQHIAETSRVWFSMGMIKATLGLHEEAVEYFKQAVALDKYLAIAYFQMGVSLFLMNQFGEAWKAFDDAHYYLRGNISIEYKQLGLDFVLYSCEALFNRGLCSIYGGREQDGMRDLHQAKLEKQTDEHIVIEEALTQQAKGYTVFSVPVGIIYRPPASKLRNLGAKDYLGKAKLIAVSEARDAYNGFSGTAGQDKTGPPRDWRPVRKASLQASHSIRNGSLSPVQLRGQYARKNSAPGTLQAQEPRRARPMNGSISEMNFSQPKPASPMPSPSISRPARAPNARSFLASTPTSESDSSPPMTQKPFQPVSSQQPSAPSAIARGKTVPPLDLNKTTVHYPPTPPDSREGEEDNAAEDLYDSYADPVQRESVIFGGPASPLASRFPGIDREDDRVADWARTTADPKSSLLSPDASPSQPLSRSGSVFRRRPDLSASNSWNSETTSNLSSVSVAPDWAEVSKIRVNVSYKGITSTMNVTPATTYDTFMSGLKRKLSVSVPTLTFKDEDGAEISLQDESDWESAVDVAKDFSNGRGIGKLEVTVAL